MKSHTRLFALAAILPLSAIALSQTPPPTEKKEDPKTETPKAEAGALKKYEEIVTKKAVSQSGVFKVHRIDDKVLFEIPEVLIGREFLMQTELAELPVNQSYPGEGTGVKVVRFTRRNNKLYLRNCDFSVRALGDDATKLGVQLSTLEPIIMAFDVQTEGKSEDGKKTAVIDVTSMYTSDPPDFTVKSAVGGMSVDGSRSYIDRVKAFPENIETRSLLTFMGMPQQSFFFGPPRPSASSVTVHYSLVLLPQKPMMGRYKDSRIGYFTQGFQEYGRPENRMMAKEYINRFRLVKKDPNAALSEPVKPITFYIAREVPLKWREAIKKGVEDWQPAYEQAGFKRGIIALDAPTKEQDPDWDAEDARYSVIRWAPSPIGNAMGPSIQDPRSGETISAHIIFWNNITELVENWYFSQVAAIDPKARKLPLPDDLMQELVRYVSAHEVGHTLGLEHNMKASQAYTVAQLRDPKFTSEFGVSPSIMDYSRFNYVAQPGDGVTRTIGMVGPYDKFAIEYGYKPVPYADDADDEKQVLDALLARQVTDPRLRFGNYRFFQDPTTQTEDIGDDAILAGTLGLRNIDRIANLYLYNATTKFGEDYSRLAALRGELMGQRMLEVMHVMRLVGGVAETDYHSGRGGDVFAPVPAAKQAAAVQFLLTQGLNVPMSLYAPKIMNKIQPDGSLRQMTGIPNMLLSSLLSEGRIQRMVDNELANGASTYSVARLVGDTTRSVFKEVAMPQPKIDLYRRSIQRSYLETIDKRVNGGTATKTDLKPLAKEELRLLALRIDKAIPKVKDPMTVLHLRETRKDIEKILNNKFATQQGGGFDMMSMFFINGPEGSCWARAFTPEK